MKGGRQLGFVGLKGGKGYFRLDSEVETSVDGDSRAHATCGRTRVIRIEKVCYD